MHPDVPCGSSAQLSSEVVERRFTVAGAGRLVPGVAWTAATGAAGPLPVVMLGHGGGSDKLSGRNQRLATLLVAAGFVAMAIDGPFHGDRVASPLAPEVYQRPDQVEADLRAVRAPTLVHVQWDDDVFPRAGGLAMFDLLAASDKRLIAHPGGHKATGGEAERQWVGFVASHLIS